MEKEGNYSGNNFGGLDYNSMEVHQPTNQIVDYMLNNNPPLINQQPPLPPPPPPNFSGGSNSFDKLSFADVMQFADLGPKLGLLNQSKATEELENGLDPVYFLKFPVLTDDRHKLQDGDRNQELRDDVKVGDDDDDGGENEIRFEENIPINNNNNNPMRFLTGENNLEKSPLIITEGNKSKRKRPRSTKTSEEVESQRMTHIAVERNRRKQMNEHLRVLRSLMPSSYVQRGDQASIIGGAIEFVRELEQLLQCLESQKRRRLYGDGPQKPPPPPPVGDHPAPPPFPPMAIIAANGEYENNGMQQQQEEETAEIKSYLADVEVKLLGFDALIKILSRRRPGQLIQTIAALEDLQLTILHTNITTIEQTVLYSFNVKIGGEARFTAEDMANSVQQIFSFIHANSTI
ncbi:hypothetical protein ABFX02_07G064500 [Erythranthe guttata]